MANFDLDIKTLSPVVLRDWVRMFGNNGYGKAARDELARRGEEVALPNGKRGKRGEPYNPFLLKSGYSNEYIAKFARYYERKGTKPPWLSSTRWRMFLEWSKKHNYYVCMESEHGVSPNW